MLKTSKLEFHEKWKKKRKNYKRYTNKKRKIKSNPNRTLKMAIKSQQQKIEEEGKKKVQQKQIENKNLHRTKINCGLKCTDRIMSLILKNNIITLQIL